MQQNEFKTKEQLIKEAFAQTGLALPPSVVGIKKFEDALVEYAMQMSRDCLDVLERDLAKKKDQFNHPTNYKSFDDFIDHKGLGIMTDHQMQVFKEASVKFLAQFNQPAELLPFDLEKALAGEKVILKDGRKVDEIFCFNTVTEDTYPVCCVVQGKVLWYNDNGINMLGGPDLFMAPPQTVTKWVNMYEDGTAYWYDTQEQAKGRSAEIDYIGTFPITIPDK